MVVTGHLQVPAATVIERVTIVVLVAGWMNITADLELLENRKICFFCPDCKNINEHDVHRSVHRTIFLK
jgi:hypothetical protein